MPKYLVVGRGLVGSVFADNPKFDVVSHGQWQLGSKYEYSGIVCAAAISTEALCQKATMTEVFEANVMLPLRLLKLAKARDVPFVSFSSAGVYREPGVRKEQDDVNPHNRYTASKVFMEHALQIESHEKLFIFRIPFVVFFNYHDHDLSGRAKRWTHCEDVTASIIYRSALEYAVHKALLNEAPGGIYNIASGSVHFPTFLADRLDWRGEIVPAHSMGRAPNCQLDTSKAKRGGLIFLDGE